MHTWKDLSSTLCRFGLKDYTLSRLALITPVSQLYFGESISLLCQKSGHFMIYVQYSDYLHVQIL